MSIIISGSLVYDHIMNFPDVFKNHIRPDSIHVLNVCFTVDKLEKSFGGTAGNISYTMKLLGADPIMLSALGSDGKRYLDYFNERDVNSEYVYEDKKQFTASSYITVDADDNEIVALYDGPVESAEHLSLYNVKEKAELVIVSSAQKDVMIKHMKECAELGIKAVFDPGPQIAAFTDIELQKMIRQAHCVIGNDYAIKSLQERSSWDADEILKYAKMLVTTLGEKGSIISTPDGEVVEVKACSPRSFDDPAGAGDAYRAGFFVGHEMGYGLKTCGQMGSVAASYAIETFGTQEHAFTRKEFCNRYIKTYGEELRLI